MEADALSARGERGVRVAGQRHRKRQRAVRVGGWRAGDREALLQAERPVDIPLAETGTRIGDPVGLHAGGHLAERPQRGAKAHCPKARSTHAAPELTVTPERSKLALRCCAGLVAASPPPAALTR